MIIVDANILAYLTIHGEHTEAVERLLATDSDWIAPPLWLDEFLNVLTTSERTGTISRKESDDALDEATEVMRGRSHQISPSQTLATARRTGCSAYDSQYLALAEDLNLPLYTFDKKLISRSNGSARRPQ